jgi:hypothetical protein
LPVVEKRCFVGLHGCPTMAPRDWFFDGVGIQKTYYRVVQGLRAHGGDLHLFPDSIADCPKSCLSNIALRAVHRKQVIASSRRITINSANMERPARSQSFITAGTLRFYLFKKSQRLGILFPLFKFLCFSMTRRFRIEWSPPRENGTTWSM